MYSYLVATDITVCVSSLVFSSMQKLPEDIALAYDEWMTFNAGIDEATSVEIANLLKAGNINELRKRLCSRLSFGTAGLRGEMKAGFSCMNMLTVMQATQGLCAYMLKAFGANDEIIKKGVVIGFDGRHNSRRFAEIATSVFVSKNVPVYLFSNICPTPWAAFAVRQLGCCGGVMVTASHNPKDDNGYKVYWNRGAQINTPVDLYVSDSIAANLQPWNIDLQLWNKSPLVKDCYDIIAKSYTELITAKLCLFHDDNTKPSPAIVYTAMHGVGYDAVKLAVKSFGLPAFIPVVQQVDPHPDFPTVAFPNPEEGKGALALAIETANKVGSNLILATDPDADRLAIAERINDKEFKIFSGNEIGSLIAWYMIQMHDKLYPGVPKNKLAIVSTAVSSHMVQLICKHEGMKYAETLTGFRYIGNLALDLADEGYRALFGYEEAIGFMPRDDIVCDKDGVRAAAMVAEMYGYLSRLPEPRNLQWVLEHVYETYGRSCSISKYIRMTDLSVMDVVFAGVRKNGMLIVRMFRCS